MNSLIKYLLYLLVILLLVSWIITVGKSCGNTEVSSDPTESYEITKESAASIEEVEEDVDFGEELESILDEEENELESIVDEDENLDYSNYDSEEDEVVVENEEVKKSKPKPTLAKTKPQATTSGRYLVIVGSYIHPDNASNQKNKLGKLGYNSEVVVFDLSEYHTVIAGRYSNFNDAQSAVNKLSNKGIDAYVKKQTF